MKKVFILMIIFLSSAFADYSIYYNKIKLGTINNFNTLKDNYIKIRVTNPIIKIMLGKKELVYFNTEYKQGTLYYNKKIYFKKDKHEVINVLKGVSSSNFKNKKIFFNSKSYLDITYDKNYQFKYYSKGKIKTKGDINIFNNEIISLNDTINNILIIKNN